MKIAVPSTGENLNSMISPRFGRAPGYLVIDSESKETKFIPNPAAGADRGAGVAAAQIIADQGVKAVVACFVGPNAFSALTAAGITVYQAGDNISVDQATDEFKAGQLNEFSSASRPGGGMGPGQNIGGRGRGRGRRR